MRILMTADTVGGVWTYALELAWALAAHGVRVDLATMGALPSDRQRDQAAEVPGLVLHVSDLRLEWMKDPWRDLQLAGAWLLGLERQLQPDLIHLNGYVHADLPWKAPVLVVGHSCVCSWWEAVKGEAPPPEWDRYRQEVARGLRAADRVLAPTHAMLAALQRHYGPLHATGVVENGRQPERFSPLSKEPVVFSAGRLWDEAKNLRLLAQAAPHLPWPVCVAGDVAHPEGGRAATGSVQWLGRVSETELAFWFGRAALYALPARYEPFGLSALEAGFAGCALVLGDIPSLREVWGDAATFVPPEDASALEAALRRLIENPELRAAMGERARQRALFFTADRMANAYLRTYRRLMASHGSAEVPTEELPCGL